jgi:hypothetical protein
MLRALAAHQPKEKVIAFIQQLSSETAARLDASMDQMNLELQTNLSHAPVFCVSELRGNVVMWSHYAEEHRGVVFKLRCDDERDNALLVAKPVRYTDRFLPFLTAEAYVANLTGEAPVDLAQLTLELTRTKHVDWAYEREWRVYLPLRSESPGNGFSFYREHPSVLEEIYLGCRMPESDIERIRAAVRAHLPGTKLFAAVRSNRSFDLDFREINCPE